MRQWGVVGVIMSRQPSRSLCVVVGPAAEIWAGTSSWVGVVAGDDWLVLAGCEAGGGNWWALGGVASACGGVVVIGCGRVGGVKVGVYASSGMLLLLFGCLLLAVEYGEYDVSPVWNS